MVLQPVFARDEDRFEQAKLLPRLLLERVRQALQRHAGGSNGVAASNDQRSDDCRPQCGEEQQRQQHDGSRPGPLLDVPDVLSFHRSPLHCGFREWILAVGRWQSTRIVGAGSTFQAVSGAQG
jgi:hypothetical protein